MAKIRASKSGGGGAVNAFYGTFTGSTSADTPVHECGHTPKMIAIHNRDTNRAYDYYVVWSDKMSSVQECVIIQKSAPSTGTSCISNSIGGDFGTRGGIKSIDAQGFTFTQTLDSENFGPNFEYVIYY